MRVYRRQESVQCSPGQTRRAGDAHKRRRFLNDALQIHEKLRSSHILGHSPSIADATLSWLQNPKGSAFCFPANTVGPVLVFVLRLIRNNAVLRVRVQFKHTETLSPQDSEKALRTTGPVNFLLRKMKNDSSPACEQPTTASRDRASDREPRKGDRERWALRTVTSFHFPSHASQR